MSAILTPAELAVIQARVDMLNPGSSQPWDEVAATIAAVDAPRLLADRAALAKALAEYEPADPDRISIYYRERPDGWEANLGVFDFAFQEPDLSEALWKAMAAGMEMEYTTFVVEPYPDTALLDGKATP